MAIRRRRLLSTAATALRRDTAVWTTAPLTVVRPAAESLFHVTVNVSDSPDLASSHTRAGQYLQLRPPDAARPSFFSIASPPWLAAARGEFEFLVKSVPGSTAEILCGMRKRGCGRVESGFGERFRCGSDFAARGLFDCSDLRYWIWN
ncbi:FAD/NAD(P)-binding oxidoreductase [Actinidia rufa]|uniref:FAD/NAD(P)-binding oxidoreductase n=1 Tax=Actinidia rufa TaxID=165716 RepID=A0A7J0GYU0_9ERIC|nr:FAD/NAD(P)-binding oxidoreductase [Actinidia rufa]